MPDYFYIYKTKFRKMGKWNLLPADSNGNWHSEETSRYFKKIFGFGKGTFIIQTLDDDIQHAYFPQFYIDFGLTLDARNEAEYLVSLCGFYVLPIYKEIAWRLSVSVKQLRNLVKKEIIACMEGQADIHAILQNQGRIIGWVFDKSMLRMKYLNSKEAQKFFDYLNKNAKNLQGNDEARGICASPGKVSGKAKIVHYPSEGNKVNIGDILITHATTVDFLPPMKRAAAFVTEVGGLTCHAAVVAREFGVPAVVSLKNATKTFQDGDWVEVDADKGIVRKIKSV